MATVENPYEGLWRQMFGDPNGHPKLRQYQRWLGRLPSSPRCRLCFAPFKGPGGLAMRLSGRAPSNRNPQYCSKCDSFIRTYPGNAEVQISMVFVDMRGSTGLAERLTPTEFRRVLNEFYSDASECLIDTNGFFIDFKGDEVYGIYPPGFSGENHAKLALEAGRRLLGLNYKGGPDGRGLPVGIGVHTSVVSIGTSSTKDNTLVDISVQGDGTHVAHGLCAAARAGEALFSESACSAASYFSGMLQERKVAIKGRVDPVSAFALCAQDRPAEGNAHWVAGS